MIAPTRILLCAGAVAVAACAPQGESSQADIEADIAACFPCCIDDLCKLCGHYFMFLIVRLAGFPAPL